MEINNLELILPFLEFSTPYHFYFLQILQRRKDNLLLRQDMKRIKAYSIYSKDALIERMPDIKDLCIKHNARAYISLMQKDDKIVALHILERIAAQIKADSYASLKNVWESAAGATHAVKAKKLWIIDVDDNILGNQTKEEFINECWQNKLVVNVLAKIPTPNGFHFISEPFPLNEFKKFCVYDVHKDNPTILYCNLKD